MQMAAKITLAEYFGCSLVELAKDSGLIGQVLRPYQDILRAADKWAEQNADHQNQHNTPGRLPLPDPWKFLIDAPVVSHKAKAVFRAAQSQIPALSHLFHIAQGFASLNTDWYQESLNASDEKGFNHASSKIAHAQIFKETVQMAVRQQNDPKLLEQMEYLKKSRRDHLVRHGRKAEIQQLSQRPSWEHFGQKNRLPVLLADWWVRCGVDGTPGLMFWRNEALTEILQARLGQGNLNPQTVKKVRQQLRLIPASVKHHFVWECSVKYNNQCRTIEGYLRNGKRSFLARLAPNQ
jgi:hypothetical protein